MLARVCKRAKLEGVTPHVLRHTFASVAGELGYSELTIAGLLGHASGSATAGYVHLDTALVSAADRASEVIAATLDGKPTAQVIRIGRRQEVAAVLSGSSSHGRASDLRVADPGRCRDRQHFMAACG